MTAIIRKVRTALNREYRKAGGIQIQDAIEQAEANLGGLTEECLVEIDQSIERIAGMTADPARRPSAKELRQIHTLVNDMLGLCAVVEIPGLTVTLYAVARLVASLIATETWLDGALTPAVNLLRIVRRGVLGADDINLLILEIDQCTDRIYRHAALAIVR